MIEQAARDDAFQIAWDASLTAQGLMTDQYQIARTFYRAAWTACEARVLRVLEAEATRYEHSSIKAEMIGRSDLQSEHGYAEEVVRSAIQAVRAAGEGQDGG